MTKWDKHFLGLAKYWSTWSKDPSTQVGAVIVNDKKIVIGQGYNGFPRGMEDSPERYADRAFKYSFILHAEDNAILNATTHDMEGATIYIYPFLCCSNCASKLIQKGIKRVVAPYSDCKRWCDNHASAKAILSECGVQVDEVRFK